MSAVHAGFKACIPAPAVRGIKPDGVQSTFDKFRAAGGTVIDDVPKSLPIPDAASAFLAPVVGVDMKWEDSLKQWLR